MKRYYRFWILGLVLTAGCDSSNQPSSQIIATVNGDEISVHQLNFNISQRGLFVQGDSDRKAITEGLIDRQLMVQEALTNKLDRQPEVMMQLEEARLQVLAAAYEKFITEKNTQPRDINREADEYYWQHPALFSQRKIYKLREIAIPSESTAMAGARERLEKKEDMASITNWLKQQPGQFSDQISIRPADYLPIEIAERLLPVKPGDTISFQLPKSLIIYQMESAEPASMDLKTARPVIEKFLLGQSSKAINKAEMERLRKTAKVTYKLEASTKPEPQ